jgi:predicted dehydrogenase
MSGDGSRVLVVGGGSIGQRHAGNLTALGARVTVGDIDPARLSSATAAGLPTVVLGKDVPDIPHGFDGVVIASPTTLHAAQAHVALATGATVFVEKPLAWTVEEGAALVAAGGPLMVGYNLRHHTPLQRVAELLAEGRIGEPSAYRLWFGQWLPDWRPNTDYRQSYSARADMGGGVLFDAIHELDLAVWFVGVPMRVAGAVMARVGPLEIDVEDTVRALLVAESGVPVSVELDYLSRQYRRGVEITGEAGTLIYDWATGLVEVREPGRTVSERFTNPVADSYQREMAEFLGVVDGELMPTTPASVAFESLALAGAIRELATVGAPA